MSKHPVVFVVLKQFDNLGIGYLASVLSEAGYSSQIIDLAGDKESILNILKSLKPLVVGFSVIFQYHIYKFKNLANFLRKGGINCHFTAGGYYASLRYEEIFKFIPSLDSVVRFDGEEIFLELVNNIYNGDDWKKVNGIAYKNKAQITINPIHIPETNLDKYPFPLRPPLKEYALGKKFTTLIAGRGCVNNCSFCNNMEYNRRSLGPVKRIRKPEKVVEEIEFLYKKMDCSVFLFQDDDFPVRTRSDSEWIERFCEGLRHKKLIEKIMWKINCRPDEIDYSIFNMMKNHGLYLVFLGIDDGTDSGLRRLNKNMTVEESLKGINILKKLDIGFDYGFMLFQPSSTISSVNDNLEFLSKICGDGYTPVSFLKLRPYFDTQVEKELRKAGRLKGKPGYLDYDFFDNRLNYYYQFVTSCSMKWLRDAEGLVNISRWARNYVSVFSKYFNPNSETRIIFGNIRGIIENSNNFLLNTMKDLLILFESEQKNDINFSAELIERKKQLKIKHFYFKEYINSCIDELVYASKPNLSPLPFDENLSLLFRSKINPKQK